jgi:hypothetical protein
MLLLRVSCLSLQTIFGQLKFCHRVETYRDVTSVPTFFVRMLGKLLDACI